MEEEQMYKFFKRQTKGIALEKTVTLLRKEYHKRAKMNLF